MSLPGKALRYHPSGIILSPRMRRRGEAFPRTRTSPDLNFGYPIPPSVPLNVPSGEGTPIPPLGDYTLTANATAGGSVSKDPDQSTYANNSIVTLTATADAGYYFYSWFGDASGANNPLSVTMDRSKTITAWFTNEIILDNSSATFAGSWSTGTSSADKYGSDYRYASTAATVT